MLKKAVLYLGVSFQSLKRREFIKGQKMQENIAVLYAELHYSLSQFRWFRKLCGGVWVYLQINVCDRPTLWTNIDPRVPLSD